jgi:hypothetical protein
MTYVGSLREDFFQRVINVNWDTEPECYFMVGDGGDVLNNFEPFGAGSAWRSDDGQSWTKVMTNMNSPSSADVGGLTCGIWMRQNFKPKGTPIWVMGGQAISQSEAAAVPVTTYSFDAGRIVIQDQETIDDNPTGTVWQMKVNGPPLAPSNVSAGILQFLTVTSTIETIDGVTWSEHSGTASPYPPGTKIRDTHQLYQLSNQPNAYGKVREGPFKGRRLALSALPIDDHHFGPTITVADLKTGKPLGAFDSGITVGTSMAYGHYVFCIAGTISAGHSSGLSEGGYIAWSDDGISWHRERLSDFELWALVVGARK